MKRSKGAAPRRPSTSPEVYSGIVSVGKDISEDKFLKLRSPHDRSDAQFHLDDTFVDICDRTKQPKAGRIRVIRTFYDGAAEVLFSKGMSLLLFEKQGGAYPVELQALSGFESYQKYLISNVRTVTWIELFYNFFDHEVFLDYFVKFQGETMSDIIEGARQFQEEIEKRFALIE